VEEAAVAVEGDAMETVEEAAETVEGDAVEPVEGGVMQAVDRDAEVEEELLAPRHSALTMPLGLVRLHSPLLTCIRRLQPTANQTLTSSPPTMSEFEFPRRQEEPGREPFTFCPR
jgi:hypothetical protein